MKSERSVQKYKTPVEKPLGKAMGDQKSNPYFATNLHGVGRPLTPLEHFIGPGGSDERMRTDVPGNQSEPTTTKSDSSSSD